MIHWKFFFDKDANVEYTAQSEEQDTHVADCISNNPEGIVSLPSDKNDIYVNMKFVKCFMRIIPEETKAA